MAVNAKVVTVHSGDEHLTRAINEAVEKANKLLAEYPTAEVVQVQTIHEIDNGGDYPRPWYTHLITIKYCEAE